MHRIAAAGCVALLGLGVLAGCSAEDPGPTRSARTDVTASDEASAGTSAATRGVPPRSGPARVELWHCGVHLLGYPEGMWEAPRPPFDETNAPDSFTGRGRASVPRTDRLVYVDAGGQRIVFLPGDEVPPVLCD